MAPTTPTGVPTELVAGDTWRWRIADHADYPQAEGWTLKYYIAGVMAAVTLTGVYQTSGIDAGYWLFEVPPSTTDDFTSAGRYQIFARFVGSGAYAGREDAVPVRDGGVDDGSLLILANPRTATAGELQSHAEKMLGYIEAELEARANGGGFLDSYQIGGRAMNRMTTDELAALRGKYAGLVARERSGRTGRRHLVEFTAPA